MQKIRSASKTDTSIRRRSCLTRQERRRPLHSRRHAWRCAQPLPNSRHVQWMPLYATTASQRWRSAATWPSSALHRRHGVARAHLLRAKDVEAGSRLGGGPGAARARAASLRHSTADCRVQNRMHAAQARLQTHVCAIKHLLTTNLRLCQNASRRTSLTAAADMKLRYAVMMYTRANTLARQELDRQQNQVVGQPVVEAALAKTSPLRTCRPWSMPWISRTASPASHFQAAQHRLQ